MIEIKELTKDYDTFTALSEVSFTVDTESICGLIGPNGAGKTTLLKTCAGIFKPDAGTVCIDGVPTYDNAEARKELFYLPDEAFYPFGATLNSMARFYRGYYPKFDTERFSRMLELFELNPRKRIHSLSKGMQRQAMIALAIASSPKYLLMDESFDGIDPVKRKIIKDLLLEYMAVSGCCVLISSHNLGEVSALCDRVVMLEDKTVKIDCETDALIEHYLKVQAIFETEIPQTLFKEIGVRQARISGQVLTGVLYGDVEEQLAALKKAGAKHIQMSNLSLEEIFVFETETQNGGDYDVEKIFA